MTEPESNRLLKEILAEEELDAFRRASRERMLTSLRRDRSRRQILNRCVLVFLPMALVMGVVMNRIAESHRKKTDSVERAETSQVKFITDEELFALFPGRPMALIGKPGQQQLVFLDRLEAGEEMESFAEDGPAWQSN